MAEGQRTRRSARGKGRRAATAAGLAGLTAVSAHVADASFSGTQSQSASANAGSIAISTADGDNVQTYTLAATDFRPGYSVERLVNLTIGGSSDQNLTSLQFAVFDNCSGCVANAALEAAGGGLQLKIERCSQAWGTSPGTTTGSSPDRTYSCGGTLTTALSNTDIANIKYPAHGDLSSGSLLTQGSTNYFKLTWTLPSNASSGTQGASAILQVKFNAVGRNAKTV